MGIFQLIDYVGIDVVRFILAVMNPYNPSENLHSPLLDSLFDLNVKGGQNSDGSQKDGLLKYEKGKPVAVFDLQKKEITYQFLSFQQNVMNILALCPKSGSHGNR